MPAFHQDQTTVMQFGQGDLGVVVQYDLGGDWGEVYFALGPSGEVGRKMLGDEFHDDDGNEIVPLRMWFDSIESLDVVLGGFECLRERLLGLRKSKTEER